MDWTPIISITSTEVELQSNYHYLSWYGSTCHTRDCQLSIQNVSKVFFLKIQSIPLNLILNKAIFSIKSIEDEFLLSTEWVTFLMFGVKVLNFRDSKYANPVLGLWTEAHTDSQCTAFCAKSLSLSLSPRLSLSLSFSLPFKDLILVFQGLCAVPELRVLVPSLSVCLHCQYCQCSVETSTISQSYSRFAHMMTHFARALNS